MLRRISPAQYILLSFALAALVGSGVLMLPGMAAPGIEVRYIDALFTATSAICVTGLITLDTATAWTSTGQTVIAVLIQIGGLGIMTGASFLFVLIGRRIGLFGRLVIQKSLGQMTLSGLVRLLLAVIAMTAVFEVIGAVILTANFLLRYNYPLRKAVGFGVFHAISAFNNAGFSTFTTSLEDFRADWVVSGTVGVLVIFGGLGFPVILDLLQFPRSRRLSLQSKLVLAVSASLLVFGFVAFLILEWNSESLAGLDSPAKLLVAWFHSLTPRTAGFNTAPMGALLPSTVFLTIFLMFVGASPQSCGGGIKTTTFGIIGASIWATTRGKHDVEMYNRRVTRDQVLEALTLLSVASAFVFVMTILLLAAGPGIDLQIGLFEVISAFGTVGLSLGLTPELSDVGKIIIIVTMYVGRVGPLTLGVGLLRRKLVSRLRLPDEQVPIG